jgi:murein DD-endopeptidase MepM/ murein hydrolase activator NlpD
LYGFDVLSLLQGETFPIQGGTLPPWPRVYPGASRIYRMGVHRGLDIYSFNAPRGFDTGYPVIAAADGTVARATIFYEQMTEEEFEAMLREAEAAGVTPPAILERLEGIQVILDHGNSVQTVYAHLDQVAPGVVTGARVRAGQVIGSVGVTGTQGESRPGTVGPHLHFEIWLGDRYLGFGLPARETMWWFASIFPASGE